MGTFYVYPPHSIADDGYSTDFEETIIRAQAEGLGCNKAPPAVEAYLL